MEQGNDRLRSAYKKVVIICLSLMASVVVYVVVAELLRNQATPWKGIAFGHDDEVYIYFRYGLLAIGIIGVLLANRISCAVNLSLRKLANPIAAMTTHAAIVAASCDMLGTLGLVLFLLAGNITDMYVFAATSLGLHVAFFPRYSRWQELAQPWLDKPQLDYAEPRRTQETGKKWWKPVIAIMSALLFCWGAIALSRDNALEESYELALWACFFPLSVIASLYFFFVVYPRLVQERGLSSPRSLSGRTIRYLFCILSSLFLGATLSFSVRSALIGVMDWLNETPTQVESLISGFGFSKECRVKVYLAYKWSFCLQCAGHRPVKTPWPLERMTQEEIYNLKGQRVVLVGRKSWAGTVIDEIRLSIDQSVRPVSSRDVDRVRESPAGGSKE